MGHPASDSFCGALAESYRKGAEAAGAETRMIAVGELDFDPVLHKGYREIQELEPDLIMSQESIKWAEHLVFVYPTWWGSFPALFKGFIDRVFLPGFGFKYRENSSLWDKLLTGRSARLIVTMDAPRWYYSLIYRNAGHNAMKHATLEFCGIKPVRITTFGSIRWQNDQQKNKLIEKVELLGSRLG